MKLRWPLLAMGAACAACCIPLLLPFLAGAGLVGASGLLFGVTLDQLLCVGLPAVVAFSLLFVWLRRRARTKAADCECSSACDIDACGPAPAPQGDV